MSKPFEHWTVRPHSKLVQVDENLLYVNGTIEMPIGTLQRRMTAARLTNGGLVIYSGIALAEAEMTELERFGTPAYLIVPNAIHRMDAKGWKERFPQLRVIAPAGAREKVAEVVPVDDSIVDFGDPHVMFITVPGTADREAALLVVGRDGQTLVLNDLIFNMAHQPGFKGWLLKTLGMTGEVPHIPALVRMREVKDKDALCSQLRNWSHLPIRRIIVSHGNIIGPEAPAILERVAEQLAA